MLILLPLAKPTKVIPNLVASFIAKLVSAEIEIIMGIFFLAILSSISEETLLSLLFDYRLPLLLEMAIYRR